MSPTIEELHDTHEYELIEKIDYQHILTFLIPYLKPSTWIMRLFFLANMLFFIMLMFTAFDIMTHHMMGFARMASYSAVSFIITFVFIVPLHELIHGLAFKILGAGNLTFGANLRQFVFYVTADRFVIRKSHFFFLAPVPFVVISLLCIFTYAMGGSALQWIAVNVLLLHATCCIGDFALVSYFIIQSSRGEVYTYDEVESRTSYFFRKR